MPAADVRTDTLCDKSITLTASGDKEIRTLDPLLARQVLSQLSYIPIFCFLLLWISIIHIQWA